MNKNEKMILIGNSLAVAAGVPVLFVSVDK